MIPQPTDVDDLSVLTTALDGADHATRLAWVRSLGKKQQVKLYALAEGQALDVGYFHDADGQVVIHHGRNSLPAFTSFEKRMVLHGDRVQGYNEGVARPLVGPGHFLVRDSEDTPGEIWVDYCWACDAAPEGFPAPAPNDRGISTLVYGNMVDVMRGVSAHVSVGRAIKKGKLTSNYFVLCRERSR